MPLILLLLFSLNLTLAKETIYVVGDSSYPPYSYQDQEKYVGIYPSFLKEVFDELPEYEFIMTLSPWKRALKEIEQGNHHILFPPYIRKKERPYLSHYINVTKEETVVFCRQNLRLESKKREFPYDYLGLTIGVNQGFLTAGKVFQDFVSKKKIFVQYAKSNSSNVKKLLRGRIDCYINDRLSVLHTLRLLKDRKQIPQNSELKIVGKINDEIGTVSFSNRIKYNDKQTLIRKLDAVIKSKIQEGRLDYWIRKYTD